MRRSEWTHERRTTIELGANAAMTTGNFSKPPNDALADALGKSYVAVHIEQGVPLLDRDLNLLGDLIAANLRQTLQRHIGDGAAGANDFNISTNGDPLDFAIAPGTFLVGGFSVTLAAGSSYKTQTVTGAANPPAPLPGLTQPNAGQPNPRVDTVYLDFWLDEIDDSQDPSLANALDVGLRTSTRARPNFLVRVAENAAAPPAAPAGHVFSPLASFSRPQAGGLTAAAVTDLRQSGLTVSGLLARVRALESLLLPSIASFSPETVQAGQSAPVTITGQNFTVGTPTVLFGATVGVVDPATLTPTTLNVHVPASATVGPGQTVTVKNAVGSAVATDTIKIEAPAAPPQFVQGNEFTPIHASAGATITLNGTNFATINRVTFNATPPVVALPGGDLLSAAANAIKVNVPVALAAGQPPCTITVSVDGAPSMTATSVGKFTIDPPAPPPPQPSLGPSGSQFTPPTQSLGAVVTLSGGANLGTSAATTQITFTGTNSVLASATDIVSIAPTIIVVKVPMALKVLPAPNNFATVTVTVNGLSITSSDKLKIA
jgi:hypothetical protein